MGCKSKAIRRRGLSASGAVVTRMNGMVRDALNKWKSMDFIIRSLANHPWWNHGRHGLDCHDPNSMELTHLFIWGKSNASSPKLRTFLRPKGCWMSLSALLFGRCSTASSVCTCLHWNIEYFWACRDTRPLKLHQITDWLTGGDTARCPIGWWMTGRPIGWLSDWLMLWWLIVSSKITSNECSYDCSNIPGSER